MTTTATDTERRTFAVELHPETRSDGKLRLRGVAAVFNSASEDMGFREQIEPGAFTEALRNGDPLLLWQHDPTSPLARVSAGNLELRETARGLEFVAELPPTSLAKDAIELVRSGVVRAMSFGFSMAGGRDRWEERDGSPWRFVEKIGRLFEISLVSEPAYAATSVEARATTATRGRLRVKEPPAYGPDGSGYSWFLDRAIVARSEHVRHLLIDQAEATAGRPSTGFEPLSAYPADTLNPDRAARRLALDAERRTLSTTATAGGNFIPSGVPEYIADAFATAARAASRLTTILPVNPLPQQALTLHTGRIDTGATTAVQATNNSSVGTLDIVEALASGPIATISGYEDVSVQWFENAAPAAADVILARELGASLATSLDTQLLGGTGSNGQLLGLISVTGIGTGAYTDASPTQAEAFPTVNKAYADLSVALGDTPTAILLHPRRSAWFINWKDSATGAQAPLRWPTRIFEIPAIPTTGGTGTNEDYVLVIRAEDLPVYTAPVVIEVFPETGSATMTNRIRARQYAATLFARRPEAIQKISGTGFAGATFA